MVERLLGLGAQHLDIGQKGVPWVVLADPEGNAFCVMEERTVYQQTGPIAALPMDTADPLRDAEFWAAMTGWVPAPGVAPATLRHPTLRGLLLELCPEPAPKRVKNRLHLDVRCDPGEDLEDQVVWAVQLGASRVEHDWGELPWVVLADPSGNEFCILPPSSEAATTDSSPHRQAKTVDVITGGGLQPGVDLDDNAALANLMDRSRSRSTRMC